MATSKRGREELQTKTAAQFFAEPGKALYTSIRELVENGLDAAESIGNLPDIRVSIEELSGKQFQSMVGIVDTERVDISLYQDHHDAKKTTKKARKGGEFDTPPSSTGSAAVAVPPPPAAETATDQTKKQSRAEKGFFKLTVQDNGCGMKHQDIPSMFGIVLTGTKYGVRQTRGKYGLGSKMVLIWSKMSTGLPIDIKTAKSERSSLSVCKLDIDLHRNCPKVLRHEQVDNQEGFSGSLISVTIAGNWTTYRAKILSYMREMAIITPYAHFEFKFTSEDKSKNFCIVHARRSDTIPRAPVEVKPHPKSLNQLQITTLIAESKQQTLLGFLTKDLSSISRAHAQRIIEEVDIGSEDKAITELSQSDIHKLVSKLSLFKFDAPDGCALSAAGTYNLRLGVIKELQPELVATCQDSVQDYEGHSFIVEAAVSIGGRQKKTGLKIYRFANRIPLLFQEGHDVVTQTAKHRINWSQYRINIAHQKVGVFVSICSTKIPFAGVNKEYINDNVIEIREAVLRSIRNCCSQLKVKLAKQRALKDAAEKKKNLEKYVPTVARSLHNMLSKIREDNHGHGGMPEALSCISITEPQLAQMLKDHVNNVDLEQAMQHLDRRVEERHDLGFVVLDTKPNLEIHSHCAVMQFLDATILQPHQ